MNILIFHSCSQGFFETARLELAQYNIGVQIICPGLVESNLLENAFGKDVDRVKKGFNLADLMYV